MVIRVLLSALSLMVALAAPAVLAQRGAAEPEARYSHRLIVELATPATLTLPSMRRRTLDGAVRRASVASLLAQPEAQAQLARIEVQQAAFIQGLQNALPGARVATFRNENGEQVQATYRRLLNAVAIEPPSGVNAQATIAQLSALPEVLRVTRDWAHAPVLYTSLDQIGAPQLWQNPAIGGALSAGAGVKIASMDGGVHHEAAMFDGAGYEYPEGYPKGDIANTNGKIIVSRAYFRSWDPPADGDENTWPGAAGISHGVHTASTAAGNRVEARLGPELTESLSGVAPAAWLMSYRVFYASVSSDQGFYTVEGIRALEDLVADGADVVINSWGDGPISTGGEYDLLDSALINAVRAGVFVSMSGGNSGPANGTTDHPSDDYISVAALSTSGNIHSGRIRAVAPQPVPDGLNSLAFDEASFGAELESTRDYGPYPLRSAASRDAGNSDGCQPWPANSFKNAAALIARGDCEFGLKALQAQEAGAQLVVIYNHETGGDSPPHMSPGAVGGSVNIPVVALGYGHGLALIDWETKHPADAAVLLSTQPYQAGNIPNIVADFSSRGPGAGNTLKPDIAAPGVYILAHGYAPGAAGEDRHLGYGQASGTSMAAPHIAGAAALILQVHPDWSPAWIKSAMMSTARFDNIFIDAEQTKPAQPLDIGAGQVDLSKAADPGVILEPPSLSFGSIPLGVRGVVKVKVTSVATHAQLYNVGTLNVAEGHEAPPPLAGLSVEPMLFTLEPGESQTLVFTWDSEVAGGIGDHQGYVRLQSAEYIAQIPSWMRVAYRDDQAAAEVLLIDNDASSSLGTPDYSGYYRAALDDLELSYTLWDADARAGERYTLPDIFEMGRYRSVVYFTGDNSLPGSSGTHAAPAVADFDTLVQYANDGGHLLVFGQDATDVMRSSFLLNGILGTERLRDGLNNAGVGTGEPELIGGMPGSPFANLQLDISARGDGAGNQNKIDELTMSCSEPDLPGYCESAFQPTLRYIAPGAETIENGYVAFAYRQQPTLDRPDITFVGSSMLFGFGLEGVNDNTGYTRRAEVLDAALRWGVDEASVQITAETALAGQASRFEAEMQSTSGVDGMRYRWDFGDGSPITAAYSSSLASHSYAAPGTYVVRVEAVNQLGTRAIDEISVNVVSPVRWTLTVNSVSVGWSNAVGRVLSIPAGINCRSSGCMTTYMDNAELTLHAEPSYGQYFVGWSGACEGRATCLLNMDQDLTVRALFYNLPPAPQ